MRRDLPGGTVTFLFSDVEGSTKLLHELGAEAYAVELAEHRCLIREACGGQGGVEVDTQGDAFFFAFASAPGALRAARTITERLNAGPIRVRIGLHTGTPHLTSEGYVGEDVHRAARIASSAHGGQVLVSAVTAALIEPSGSEPQALSLLNLGTHRLKDLPEPLTLFQLGEGAFPPLKTIANSNLPTPASSFLGREKELYEADQLLQETRLLTIIGPGGGGKTRFALELARRAREERFLDYEDGVFCCFLASLRDPALVLPTIAQTLSLREQPGLTALETLASQLQDKKLLLLLDNLEHLLACARTLSELAQSCPGLTLLSTSRELLRLEGERPYDLPPLAEAEGVALFCERAQVAPSDMIRELCARLEGLPLALELAASRLRLLSPEQLLARLSQRLDLLKAGRDVDPRQQTLRATIQWSYDLLSDEEQALFAQLSVFAGGCTLEAAEEVCDADLDALESLLDQSLLRRSDTELGPRFWMLETIREYAAEALAASGGQEEVLARFAAFFTRLAEEADAELRGPSQEVWLRRLDLERDNFRAARAGLAAMRDGDGVIRLARALSWWWARRGQGREAYDTVSEGLRIGVRDPSLQVHGLRLLAFTAYEVGMAAQAASAASEAVALARRLGDGASLAEALEVTALTTEDVDEAGRLLDEVEELYKRLGDVDSVARTAINRGHLALAAERLDEALVVSQRAEQLVRGLGNQHGVGVALANQAIALALLGDVERAADTARSSIESLLVVGDALSIAGAAEVLAAVACEQGDVQLSARLLGAIGRQRELAVHKLDLSERRMHAAALDRLSGTAPGDDLARWQAEGARAGLAAVLADAGVDVPAEMTDAYLEVSRS